MHWPHLSFQQVWLLRFYACIWIVTGIIWMRRAYLGERGRIRLIINPSSDRSMNQRQRMSALFLGIVQALIGLATLVVAQK
jgi:hypothetical protein